MGFNNFLNNLRRAAEAMENIAVNANTNNQNYDNNSTYDDVNIKKTTNNGISKNILEKLVAEDKDFAEAKFRAKVDNMFIQTYTGVMKQDLSKVEHFLSKEMFEKYSKKVENLKSKNQLQIYDELNVSDTNIINIDELEDKFVIKVSLLTKYLDYIITKDTKKYISGNREVRVEKRVKITLSKIKNAKSMEQARKCDGCGANMDLNKTGVCEYCGTVFELKNYDWVIDNIED